MDSIVVINKSDWRREDPNGIPAIYCPGKRHDGRMCRALGSLDGYNISREGFVQPRVHHDQEDGCGFVGHVRLEGWPSIEIPGVWREPPPTAEAEPVSLKPPGQEAA